MFGLVGTLRLVVAVGCSDLRLLFIFLLLLLLVPNLMVQPIDETLSKRVSVVIVLIFHHTSIQVQRLVHSRE